MSGSKKVLNVFGIIFASILSVVLVLSLIAAPIVLSSLSLLSPKNLSNAITSVDVGELIASDNDDADMAALLSTNAAKEVFELYATDISNSLSGKTADSKLTKEALQKIAEDNIDELAEFMMEHGDTPDVSVDEVKQAITTSFANEADEILAMLPDPKELTQQVVTENPELKSVFDVIGNVNSIKFSIIGTIIVISALIFVCRLFDLRGFKWLSIDLFVASGFLILVCIGIFLGAGAVELMTAAEGIIGGIVANFLSSFKTGMVIRTAVMLAFGIALMVAYVYIKKAKAKKATATENVAVAEDTVAEIIEEAAEEVTDNETV